MLSDLKLILKTSLPKVLVEGLGYPRVPFPFSRDSFDEHGGGSLSAANDAQRPRR
jgi:hypothetical protein